MEYYVYWNSQQVVDVLNAIAGIMNSGAYTGIVRAMGVLGLMAAVMAGIWRLNKVTETIGLYWMGLTLVYLGLLVPTTTVTVRDIRAGTSVPVANVPIGIGVFASELSHIGHWLTTAYETAFVPPATNDVNRFARFGFQGPQRVLDAATRAQLQAPMVTAMLNKVMSDCVMPELMETPSRITQLRQKPDILAEISTPDWVNAARTTTLTYSPTNDPAGLLQGGITFTSNVPCDQAVTILNASIGAAVTQTINQYAIELQPGRSLLASTAAPGALSQIGALINGATGGADAVLTGSARTAADIVKQAAAMQSLELAANQAAATPGSTEVAMSVAVANRSSSVQYDTMRALAQEALPKLRNAVELIIIASWPIVGLLLIMAGSKMIIILQSYLVMVLWVQLWAPLYAVVNYLTISADSTPYGRAMAMFGGGTPEAMTMIAQLGATSQQVGGMLALAIPAIALALAKGGEMAATNMISTVMGPSSSAAGSSASQLAQGNMNLGNTSWGNSSEYNNNAGNRTWGNTSTGQGRTGLTADGSSSVVSPERSTQSDGFGSAVFQGGSPTALKKEESNLGKNSFNVQDSARAAQRLEAATQGANETQSRAASALRGAMDRFAGFQATGQSMAETARHSAVGTKASDATQSGQRGSVSTGTTLKEDQGSSWNGNLGATGGVGIGSGGGGGKPSAPAAASSNPFEAAQRAATNALRALEGEPPLPSPIAAAPAGGGGPGIRPHASGGLSATGSYNRHTGDSAALDKRAQSADEAAKTLGKAIEYLDNTTGKTGQSQTSAASTGMRASLTQAKEALQAHASSLRELQSATKAFETSSQGSVTTSADNTHAPMAAALNQAGGNPMEALRQAASGGNVAPALATQASAVSSDGGQAAINYAQPPQGVPASASSVRSQSMSDMAATYASGTAGARSEYSGGAGQVRAAGGAAGVTPEQPGARGGAESTQRDASTGIDRVGTSAAVGIGRSEGMAMGLKAVASPQMNLSPADRNAAATAIGQVLSSPPPATSAGREQRATELQALRTLGDASPTTSPKDMAAAAFVVHSMLERATASQVAVSDPGAGTAVQNQTQAPRDNSGRRGPRPE